MDLRLIAHDGVFSTADATRLGLDRNALARMVRDGRCLRLATGWYAEVEDGCPDPEALHRLRSITPASSWATCRRMPPTSTPCT